MAQNAAGQGFRRGSRNDQANFANVTLNASDKESFQDWCSEVVDDFENWVDALVDDSYRLTVKFDYNNSCYQSSLTQQDNKHANAHLVIVSRAGTWMEAILMAAYKVFVMYPDQRLPSNQDGENNWG